MHSRSVLLKGVPRSTTPGAVSLETEQPITSSSAPHSRWGMDDRLPLGALSQPAPSEQDTGKASRDSAPSPTLAMTGSEIGLDGKRVVICEDEAVTQMQLRRALTRAGMAVVGIATNGREAVETTLREKPDIVLMDIRMPVMDGIAATRQILSRYDVCVVMLTAFSNDDYQDQARAMGACGYIVKPITSDVLLPLIQQALDEFQDRHQH